MLWKKYLDAYERGKIKGFVPVYIVCDENVCQTAEYNAEDAGKKLEEYRQQLLSAELPDANKLLKERFDEYMKLFNENFLYKIFTMNLAMVKK